MMKNPLVLVRRVAVIVLNGWLVLRASRTLLLILSARSRDSIAGPLPLLELASYLAMFIVPWLLGVLLEVVNSRWAGVFNVGLRAALLAYLVGSIALGFMFASLSHGLDHKLMLLVSSGSIWALSGSALVWLYVATAGLAPWRNAQTRAT
jgi:hypothetical protein